MHLIMLKKFILALACLPFSFSGFAAQLSATLQSGDRLTPFYGDSAFVKAHEAAVAGDVITLSPGTFVTTEITKGITVVGAYAFSEDTSKATCMGSITISADNVTVEGVRITETLTMKGCDQLSMSRCYIKTAKDVENGEHKYHNNTVMTDCLILAHEAMSLSQNAVMRNCCINHFNDLNDIDKPALIENCNIPLFSYYEYSTYRYKQPYAVYRNCFLGLYSLSSKTPVLSFTSPSEFHNNIFKRNYYYKSGDSFNYDWTINYGSCIAQGNVKDPYPVYNTTSESEVLRYSRFSPYTYNNVTYGPSNHKEYPAVPVITSSEIDTETDADGILHVKISAEARD